MINKRLFGVLLGATLTCSIYYSRWYRPRITGIVTKQNSGSRPPIVNKANKSGKILEDLRRSSYLNARQFNISGHDVMLFLHIQKTGGTAFGKNLVKNLELEQPCEKIIKLLKARFECKRPNSDELWLYSRYSTGWLCGVHADWTTLHSCIPTILKTRMGMQNVNEARFFYISLFRDPIDRFLSEFKHVQRGATWKTSIHVCNETKHNLPLCYNGSDWRDVTLPMFLSCPHNLAFNRQVRMLANLNEIGCYNRPAFVGSRAREYEKSMLESAKKSLRALAYFGLVEYQKESQYLFEKTFRLKFKKDFRQVTVSDTWSAEARKEVTPKQLLQIRKTNRLDRQLYSYAKTLFFKRLKYFERLYEKGLPSLRT